MASDFIESCKYQGHTGSVTCLDLSETSSSSVLLSGSEDGTARIWDLRSHRRRAVSCIQTHGEVSAVKLGTYPLSVNGDPDEGSSSSTTALPFAHDLTVFLSVENCVYAYDLRKATTPVIQQPSLNLSPILQHQDDVNQLQLVYYQHPPSRTNNKKSNKKSKPQQQPPSLYLASCDDAGTVRMTDLYASSSSSSSQPNCQLFPHDKNRVSLVPACQFRPISSQKVGLELVSGGTDCKLQLWSIPKQKTAGVAKPVSSITITPPEETPESQANKPQVCNPPMIYSLDFSPSGQLLAAGLGNGDVSILSIHNRSLVQVGLLTPGHDASVASVLFPTFCPNNERVLITGGNDGAILCWDLGTQVFLGMPNETENLQNQKNPTELFSKSLLEDTTTATNNTAATPTEDLTAQMEGLSTVDSKPKILFGIPHGTKPNWMVTQSSPSTLFVADTSNDITAYSIPLR